MANYETDGFRRASVPRLRRASCSQPIFPSLWVSMKVKDAQNGDRFCLLKKVDAIRKTIEHRSSGTIFNFRKLFRSYLEARQCSLDFLIKRPSESGTLIFVPQRGLG